MVIPDNVSNWKGNEWLSLRIKIRVLKKHFISFPKTWRYEKHISITRRTLYFNY